MKKLTVLLLLLGTVSCIPLRVAPTIRDYKIVVAKKFKGDLPREYAFVFEDPKEADEFYHYINTKFNLDHQEVDLNVPMSIGTQTVYMSFYERERVSKTANIFPVLVDAVLATQDTGPFLEETYSSRSEYWYILITVRDSQFKDCLAPDYPRKRDVVRVLWNLKQEYLATHDYEELLLSKR